MKNNKKKRRCAQTFDWWCSYNLKTLQLSTSLHQNLANFQTVNFTTSKPHNLRPVASHSMSISYRELIQATKPCYFNYSPALYSSIGVRLVIMCIVSEINFRREVKHAKLVKSNRQISLIRLHYGWALGWFK